MKADIWMPLYIGDYLADTSRLTTEQHGAYLLLLMDYWRSGKLPDNDQVLTQICKMNPDAWSNAKAMLSQFFSIENGYWVHKRVEQEMADAKVNQVKKHERAVKAAEARWKNATSNANAIHKQCPSPSPSPSPNKSNISSKRFEEFWDAYGKKRGKPKALKEWQKAKIDDELASKVIEQAKKQAIAISDPQFRKDPERWLKYKGWEDEIIVIKESIEDKALPLGTDAQIEAAYRAECGDPAKSRFQSYYEMRNYIIEHREKRKTA